MRSNEADGWGENDSEMEKSGLNGFRCSFQYCGTIPCGPSSVAPLNLVIPLIKCDKPILSHLKLHHINAQEVHSECQLVQAKGGLFDVEAELLTVCPVHRMNLGLKWRGSKYCPLQYICKKAKALKKGTINKQQSVYLLEEERRLVPLGSGVCSHCRKILTSKMSQSSTLKHDDHDVGLPHESKENSDQVLLTTYSVEENTVDFGTVHGLQNTNFAEEERLAGFLTDQQDFSESTCCINSQGSEWLPDSQDSASLTLTLSKKQALDNFLQVCGLSPVKKTLQSPWQESSERTKGDYIRKSHQIFSEVLKVLAPGQENFLAASVLHSQHEDKINMVEVISLAYKQATDLGTQRQILSLNAPDYSLTEIKKYLPQLTKYKYTMATKHTQSTGRGMPHISSTENREHLSDTQINYFLDFVMSPVVMTDIPFGQIHLKLSSGQKIDAQK